MYRLSLIITIITLLVVPASSQTANSGKNLSYSISLNKSSYLPLEQIIVISKLKNTGNTTIEVDEPSGIAFVVTYDLYKTDPNGRQLIGSRIVGRGRPAWTAQKVTLKTSEECESSCELDSQVRRGKYPPGLMSGEYIVKSTYHMGDYGTQQYEKNVLFAEVHFRIEPLNDNQTSISNEFSKYYAEDRNPTARISNLEAFLKKYPDLPYKQLILETLVSDLYQIKDYKKAVTYYREDLKGEISTGRKERKLSGLANTYLQLGDTKEAINILSQAKLPQSVQLKEQLEKGQIPSEYKAAIEEAKNKSDPNASSK